MKRPEHLRPTLRGRCHPIDPWWFALALGTWALVLTVLALAASCFNDEISAPGLDAGACCNPVACRRDQPACCELPDAAPLCEAP